MMRFAWSIGIILNVLFFLSACKKSNNGSLQPSDGNNSSQNTRLKMPQGISFFSGRNRAFLTWKNNEKDVSKVIVYWNYQKDSTIKKVATGTDSIKVYIEDLEEGDYDFGIYVMNEKGKRSSKVLKSGHVFGEIYDVAQKKIKNVTYTDNQTLKIDWADFNAKNAVGVQINYRNKRNDKETTILSQIGNQTILKDISSANRGKIIYRTVYIPGGLIQDTLFTAYDTVAYVNRKAIFDSLPGWKFRCKVKAESQTISDFGGILAFKKKMDEGLKKASKKFQVPGINDARNNEVHFYMTDISSFTGASEQFRYIRGVDSTDLDLLLVVNGHAANDDLSWGWLGAPYLTLGHDYAGLFVPNAIDALTHEFGHFRGMYDTYFANVTAANNPISGQAYKGKRDIMNSPYGETEWSELSKVVFNASADKKVAIKYWSLFSNHFQIKVKDNNGMPAEGATINLYPVERHSTSANTVRENDVIMYRGTTNAEGVYDFDGNNPFAIGQNPSNDIFNFLVKVKYNGKTVYSWMPLDDALVAGSKDETYTLSITMP